MEYLAGFGIHLYSSCLRVSQMRFAPETLHYATYTILFYQGRPADKSLSGRRHQRPDL